MRGAGRGRAGSGGARSGARGSGAGAPRSAADGVDWEGALRLARVATPAGPHAPGATRRSAVALLRRSAQDALPWAAQITGLTRAARQAADTTTVLVVDRVGLQRANIEALRALMGQVPDSATQLGPLDPAARAAGRAAVTAAVAGLLGLVSTRVLGQVLPGAWGAGAGAGAGTRAEAAPRAGSNAPRMLLVAPNVLRLQRERDLDRLDLPAWVALHESAHVLQLAAAPWLVEYLAAQVTDVATALMGPAASGEPAGVARLARAVREAARTGTVEGEPSPLLTDRLGAQERARLSAVAATMALLEGHAEAVLDAVEPSRMPSVHRLRAVLGHSRGSAAGTALERLLGVEAKQAQYVDGAAFVRGVVGRVGHAGLNVVWREPANLPRPEEICRPEAWIERMGL
ncbi:coenzyme F420 biosynthesis protein [Actinomyces sp. 432]|uniref:zinc-dependent metalloprotease n=1 Tax=Actinomyces sp. 432 TaxID=2057798 RepID=UPI0013741AF8|nr:zinc-dependent metalloprotease [Actinomyces sp. 432]QHO92346.1 coenzyme F420 biosynthesis protein [Actinomyces sp. 432]